MAGASEQPEKAPECLECASFWLECPGLLVWTEEGCLAAQGWGK
jgi:hypothetical protein